MTSLLPSRRLAAALLFCLLSVALAIGAALEIRVIGVVAMATPEGQIEVQAASQGTATLPPGAVVLAFGAGEERLSLEAEDVLDEPDVLDTYAQLDRFFQRQSALATLLNEPLVNVQWRASDGSLHETVLVPRVRTLADLPVAFWFQLAVSTLGCLIAAWVWALRPGEWGARMFALTGLSFPVFALPAAVYSTRGWALDGTLFRQLSALNHGGAVLFGAALVAVFLCAPRRLVPLRGVAAMFGVYALWWLTDTLRWAPDLDWGHRFAVMGQMLLALVLAGVQWLRSHREPAHRASLRWFILSLLVGSGLFVLLTVVTVTLGWLPPIPQGYAFGFFLFIYIGIALGLGRYRLFELDAWAYRLLLWLGAALAVVGLDAAFVLLLQWSSAQALTVSIWLIAMAYFPARHWLWQRYRGRHSQHLQELLPEVVDIAFQGFVPRRERMWDALLTKAYQPLELRACDTPLAEPAIAEDGLVLEIPACAGIAPRTLRYPYRGGGLFHPRDLLFVRALLALMDRAELSRSAQERSVLEERQRIARDLHDDVGARLLMLIHHARSPEIAALARAAMQDLRTALGALEIKPVLLEHALADWRAEVSDRCEAAQVDLRWSAPPAPPRPTPPQWLPPRTRAMLERFVRECITNALKHGLPGWIEVRFAGTASRLTVDISHDGTATQPGAWQEGRGLRGMRQRVEALGGDLVIEARAQGGSCVRLQLPMEAPHDA